MLALGCTADEFVKSERFRRLGHRRHGASQLLRKEGSYVVSLAERDAPRVCESSPQPPFPLARG